MQIITVINGFDGALDEIMAVVVGVGDGAARIAELHLQRSINVGPRLKNHALAENPQQNSRQKKPAHGTGYVFQELKQS